MCRENDGKIEAELMHVLRRLEKMNDDQYSRKKVRNTSVVSVKSKILCIVT